MRIISIRIEDNDMKYINYLKEQIQNRYRDIYTVDHPITNSSIIRMCIRSCYENYQKESNKMDS